MRAKLVASRIPADPRAAVLVLHGGASRGTEAMVSPTQLSVLRMIPIAQRISRAGGGQLAVFRLLNSRRGWDSAHTPVDDARWALQQLRERLGRTVPTCLVGHSLGGRAALLAAGQPEVRSVVALAPWVYPSDGETDLAGRDVLIVHGDSDRVASAQRSRVVAEGLGARNRVGYVEVAGGTHAMLRHHATFDGLAAQYATATLLGKKLLGKRQDGPVGRILDGERWIRI